MLSSAHIHCSVNFPPVWTTAALCLCPNLLLPRGQTVDTRVRLTTSDVIGGAAVQVGSAPLSLHKNSVVCIPEHRDPTAVRDKEDSCLQTFDNRF